MVFTVLVFLYGQRHVKLPMLSVRHDKQVFVAIVVCVAIHMVDDFSGLERTSEVYFRFLSGLFGIDLPSIGYSAVRISLCIELGQMSCLVATGHGCEVYVLPHPFVSVLCAAETVSCGVCSFELCATQGALDFHVAPPIPKRRSAKLYART